MQKSPSYEPFLPLHLHLLHSDQHPSRYRNRVSEYHLDWNDLHFWPGHHAYLDPVTHYESGNDFGHDATCDESDQPSWTFHPGFLSGPYPGTRDLYSQKR